jgi:hypothetical protein
VKAAVASLRALFITVVLEVGLEGWFLVFGTLLLAVGSSYINPAGPWLVTGSVALLLGLALAVPVRRGG